MPLHAFDGIEVWAQLWTLHSQYFTEAVARNLQQMPEIFYVQIRDITKNGFEYFRVRMTVNLSAPLRKYIFLSYANTIEGFGMF